MGEYHDALSEGGVTAYSMYDAWEDYRCVCVWLNNPAGGREPRLRRHR